MASVRGGEIFNVVIGTAGHIDHGKSTLVKALTGIDPDRLPEEKEREMTIDLGFAPLVLASGKKVGIIDVPGHERFIKNMVAGATGIDLALLVVAANDGIMLQTREHLDIMKLLGLKGGIVVITKADVADPDLLDLVREEIRDFVRGSFLEAAPVIPVSSVTRQGFPELLQAIERMVSDAGPRPTGGVFRMPIQRVFSAKGFGTVVTGVPVSGEIAVGDEVEILPAGLRGKVRSLQAYREDVQRARAGHSTAMAVTDVAREAVRRGDVAAQPGYFQGATLLEARLTYLAGRAKPLEGRTQVRLHVGTSEVLGEVVLLEKERLAPGEESLVQLRLREPVVVAPGDRYIVRLESPTITIGGGDILGTTRYRLKPKKEFVIEQLEGKAASLGEPRAYVASLLRAATEPMTEEALRYATKQPDDALAAILADLVAEGVACPAGHGRQFVHRETLERAERRIRDELDAFFKKNPLKSTADKVAVRAAVNLTPALFDAALASLVTRRVVQDPGKNRLALEGRRPALSEAQERRRDGLVAALKGAGYAPPGARDLAVTLGGTEDEIRSLVALLAEEGLLVRVADDVVFHRDAVAAAEACVLAAFGEKPELVSAEFKDRIKTTRKYAIPLLEYFDAQGLTELVGGVRVLKRKP